MYEHVLILDLTDKIDLRRGEKTLFYTYIVYTYILYTVLNIRRSHNNNKFKISAPAWNDEFELPDGSNSTSDIQDYSEYI